MNPRVVVRMVVVAFVTLVVQSSIGLEIRVVGVHPDLMLLLPIAAGIAGGPEEGAVMGFIAGIAADLVLPTPFGLSALVGCVVGFAVGAASAPGSVVRDFPSLWPLIAAGASIVGELGYATIGGVLGQGQFLRVDLLAVVGVVAVCNAILAIPAVRVSRWALAPTRAERPRAASVGTGAGAGTGTSRW